MYKIRSCWGHCLAKESPHEKLLLVIDDKNNKGISKDVLLEIFNKFMEEDPDLENEIYMRIKEEIREELRDAIYDLESALDKIRNV